MTAEEWNTYFAGHWIFAGARQNNHIAMFPEELPRRLIKMFSFIGKLFWILLLAAEQPHWLPKILIEILLAMKLIGIFCL